PAGTIAELNWSPDGKSLAFLFHPLGKEIKLDGKGKPETPVYRYIKDIWFRLDGSGFFDSEYTHVWTADARTGKTRQLVEGAYHDQSIAWSPDNNEIAFISFRHSDWQLRLEEQKIYTVPTTGGEVNEVPTVTGPKDGLSYSPDGQFLAYFGHEKPYLGWGVASYILNVIDQKGQVHRRFGEKLDRTAYSITLGDITPAFGVEPPRWSTDGKFILYRVSSDGGQPIVRAELSSGVTEYLTE
ncbi:MAG: hypothetical protein GY869_13835, partial [Planctomycetes bacterium]|nr:hypothetical protein [Planctomycetota bacterium]